MTHFWRGSVAQNNHGMVKKPQTGLSGQFHSVTNFLNNRGHIVSCASLGLGFLGKNKAHVLSDVKALYSSAKDEKIKECKIV